LGSILPCATLPSALITSMTVAHVTDGPPMARDMSEIPGTCVSITSTTCFKDAMGLSNVLVIFASTRSAKSPTSKETSMSDTLVCTGSGAVPPFPGTFT